MPEYTCEVRPFDVAKPTRTYALKERSLALDLRPVLNVAAKVFAPRSLFNRYWRTRSVALAMEWIEENMAAIDLHLVDWVDEARQSLQSQMQNSLNESKRMVLTTLETSRSQFSTCVTETTYRVRLLDGILNRLSDAGSGIED